MLLAPRRYEIVKSARDSRRRTGPISLMRSTEQASLHLEAPEYSGKESDDAAGGRAKRNLDDARHRDQAATHHANVSRHERVPTLSVIVELAVRVVGGSADGRTPSMFRAWVVRHGDSNAGHRADKHGSMVH